METPRTGSVENETSESSTESDESIQIMLSTPHVTQSDTSPETIVKYTELSIKYVDRSTKTGLFKICKAFPGKPTKLTML